jgi:serine/threonine protein kinase
VQIRHEVQLHAELDHPNVLPLYGAFCEEEDIYLVMPYAHQGSVYHLLRQHSLSEQDLVTEIVLPFLAGLQHLHSKGYLHRDIKTENVLVDMCGRVMIADFGLAIDTKNNPAVHRVGTPVYMVRSSHDIHCRSLGYVLVVMFSCSFVRFQCKRFPEQFWQAGLQLSCDATPLCRNGSDNSCVLVQYTELAAEAV